MLNKRQREVLRSKLTLAIYLIGVARGNYYASNPKAGVTSTDVDNAYMEKEEVLSLVKELIKAETNNAVSDVEAFKYLGLDYDRDYIEYVVFVEEMIIKRHEAVEEDIPF